jgi:predicted nucleic acid-binding protein
VKWLLDTNVVSEGVRNSPSRVVTGWIAEQSPDDLAISVVTVAELREGTPFIRDEARRDRLDQWIDVELAAAFRDRTLPVTIDTLIDWLGLARKFRAAGDPRDSADLLLASTARIRNLAIVTRNVRHFANTGTVIYNPWTNETHKMEAP